MGVRSGRIKGDDVHYPKTCPTCGAKTDVNHTPPKYSKLPKDYVPEPKDKIIDIKGVPHKVVAEEMWELVCPNEDCGAVKLNNYLHFLDLMGVLGLGEATVQQLIDGGKLPSRAAYYDLTVKDCKACGLSDRESLLAVARIWMVPAPTDLDDAALEKTLLHGNLKIKVPFGKFFAALGIPTAGKSAGKELAKHFGTWAALEQATVDELRAVEGVGDKTAPIVSAYLNKHAKEIHNLLKIIELEKPKTGKLTGKVYCLSGSFPGGKEYFEKQIEDAGGTVVSSVSKKLTSLIAGPGSEGKSAKAKELGVPIIDLDALKKIL